MPPKKDNKKKEAKPGNASEYSGPNIYKELVTKPVTEIDVDPTAPLAELMKQNIEYDVIIDRLQTTI